MYTNKNQAIEDRIVSIHQIHVQAMVRGKANAKVEFGAKINVALVDGFSLLDDHSFDLYNECTPLQKCVVKYKARYGYYPKEVIVDKIYCTRENREYLKSLRIILKAKPLGSPSKIALSNQVSPREHNLIEGKFGHAKTAYDLVRIKVKLANTSE
jgi:IS5 family transposase